MLAWLPTKTGGNARVPMGPVCLLVVHALIQACIAPDLAFAQGVQPPVVVETALPIMFDDPPPANPPIERTAPPAVTNPPIAPQRSNQGVVDREPNPTSARTRRFEPSTESTVTSAIAAEVVVEPVPEFDLNQPAQQSAVVRPALPMNFVLPDPTRTRTKAMEVKRLSDVANPTPQTTVVPAKPPAETMEFLRLSDPNSYRPQTAVIRARERARQRALANSSAAPATQAAPPTQVAPRAQPAPRAQARQENGLLRLSDPNRNRSPQPAPTRKVLPDYVLESTPPTNSGTESSRNPSPPPTAGIPSPGLIGIDIGLSERPLPQGIPGGSPAPADVAQGDRRPAGGGGLLRLSDSKPNGTLLEQPAPGSAPSTPLAAAQEANPNVQTLPEPRRQSPVAGAIAGSEPLDEIKMLRLSEGAAPQSRSPEQRAAALEVIPAGFEPWWQNLVMQQSRAAPKTVNIDVNSLIVDALRYSAQVQAISDEAIIAQTSITRAAAEFDTEAFMETRLVRTNVPTGSTLEAGGTRSRLKEYDWNYSAGLRKKNELGGRFEISQRVGGKTSNSEFFTPANQGNSRLTLSYNQPLLNGGGEVYNSSLILMAKVDSTVAYDRTALQLQDQLLEVTESMWELYIQRSLMLQKRRHLERATAIHSRLVRRRGIDVLESQIARAGAAVATRRTELIRAETAVRNAEAYLRALVNSPTLLADRASELVPVQPPASYFVPVDLHDALATALNNRPDIDAAAQEIEAARIRLKVARNELLPVLDAVLETYVSGLRGDLDIASAFSDQFQIGAPSYTAGLVFENPIHRRSAKANHLRRRIELRQLSNKFKAAVESLNADVEVAVREVETAYREMQANYQSMTAAQSDADYLLRRWETLPGDDRSASFMLEDLLDAQDRLAAAEFDFTRAQVAYTMSLTYLNRATGTLLKQEKIKMVQGDDCGLPTIRFEKTDEQSDAPTPNVADRVRPLIDPGQSGRRQ